MSNEPGAARRSKEQGARSKPVAPRWPHSPHKAGSVSREGGRAGSGQGGSPPALLSSLLLLLLDGQVQGVLHRQAVLLQLLQEQTELLLGGRGGAR